MASMTIRSTYALDRDTVERLDRLARQWAVSKSEALRRAVRAARADAPVGGRLDALDRLQASMQLSPAKAEAWARDVRRERARHTKRLVSR